MATSSDPVIGSVLWHAVRLPERVPAGRGRRGARRLRGVGAVVPEKGASAVIAPLWNVRDTIAREISLEFYRTVYGSAERGEQITAGEALRQVRAKFNPRSQNATYVAYQLYGDPNLQLTH